MAANPASINFQYTKFSGNIPQQEVTVTVGASSNGVEEDFQFQNNITIPNYLEWVLISEDVQFDNSTFVFRFFVKENAANALNAGIINDVIHIKGTFEDPQDEDMSLRNWNAYVDIEFEVLEIPELSISPTQIVYNEIVGSPNPPSTPLIIESSNNWVINSNESWISFSQNSGTNDSVVELFVDISGFSAGTYTGEVLVDDGSQKTAQVTVNMSGGTGGNQYLVVTPDLLDFSENQGEAPESSADVVIETSQDCQISTNVNWLNLSANSFTSGISQLSVNTQNTESLSIGTYLGKITVSSLIGTREVNVLLRIISEIIGGIKSSELYFAKAQNKLIVGNSQANAELLLKHQAVNDQSVNLYSRKIPFFQNRVVAVIGLETEKLLTPESLPSFATSKFYIPFKPLKINLEVFDKQIGQSNLSSRKNYNDMKFLNGDDPRVTLAPFFNLQDIYKYNPIAEIGSTNIKSIRLCYLPKEIVTHQNAFLSMSVYQDNPIQKIQITGKNISSITRNIDNSPLYSGLIKISELGLKQGDKVSIDFGMVKTDVTIRNQQHDDVKIIWKNDWDCDEIYNADGGLTITDESENEEIEYFREGKTLTEISDIKRPIEFRVNTGLIYSDEEVNQLNSILSAKKIWLRLPDGKEYKVIRKFDKLERYNTRSFDKEYALKFKLAEI